MNRLFVFGTLTSPQTRKDAVGRDLKVLVERAYAPGMVEIQRRYAGQKWPTMVPMANMHTTGQILLVNDDDLKKLDKWEANYRRQTIATDRGDCWTYIFKVRHHAIPGAALSRSR